MNKDFDVVETTIADVLRAYSSGAFTARQLVQAYIDRINTYDQQGPVINALVSLNREALAEADRLDGLLKDKGLSGPLHGIPIVVKDQADVKEMPTTMGSVLFEGHMPERDCFVAAKLRAMSTISTGPPVGRLVARRHACRRTFLRWASARKVSRRFAGRRLGTVSLVCGLRPGWLAGRGSIPAGHQSLARSGRWRARLLTLPSY
jgi:hypothetical protein